MTRGFFWPACLPQRSYEDSTSLFTGGADPIPLLLSPIHDTVADYVNEQMVYRSSRMEPENICQDPFWMRNNGVNTYYPPATTCYKVDRCVEDVLSITFSSHSSKSE